MPGKLQLAIRIGDKEEVLDFNVGWKPVAVEELERYHAIDGAFELADCISQQILMTLSQNEGKPLRDAILRLVGHKPKPIIVHGEERAE